MEQRAYHRFLLVKDHFYTDPNRVVLAAQQAEYYEPQEVTGFRSTTVYHEPGIRQKLEKILGIKITRWDTDPIAENGVFYHGFSKGNKKEVPGVHSDFPINDITVLIYLSKHVPLECGTSLWMHRKFELIDQPTASDARRLKMKLSDIKNQLEVDSKQRSKWIEVDRVGHVFNRMVAYPSGAFHSATNHFGSNMKNGRIYQTYRIGVDWDSFKLIKL